MLLTDAKIKALKPKSRAYKITDQMGLQIQINPSESKIWQFRYRFQGKEKVLSFGHYPEIGLLEHSVIRLNCRDSQTVRSLIQDGAGLWRLVPMARAYSQDLRDRVIDAVLRQGLSRRAAARHFGVSEASSVKWLQRYERLDDRRPAGTGGHRPSKVKPERAWLLRRIDEVADLTLQALCDQLLAERGVKVDTGMLSRFFREEGISFKKKRTAQRAGSPGRGAQTRTLVQVSEPA
jgi:transposase